MEVKTREGCIIALRHTFFFGEINWAIKINEIDLFSVVKVRE
jgi:hypothetical protein